MRFRNESLRTGSLITWFEPSDRASNRSLLFLVAGTADIEPLTAIESVCRQHIQETGLEGFEWNPVPDQGQLSEIDPLLDASRLTRLEVQELSGLTGPDMAWLLAPALDRLARGETELFPAAGGAVGAPAEGIQFLGRDSELETLASWIREGTEVLLLAPRRSGKTSVLRRLEKILAEDHSPVFFSLERDLSPEDAAARLWVQASGERYRPAQRLVTERGWQPVFADALHRLAGASRPLVLLLDELVLFLQNLRTGEEGAHRSTVTDFLTVLSGVCAEVRARLIVAGSLDLLEYLRESVGLQSAEIPPRIRELKPFHLPPLALDSPSLALRLVLLGTGIVPEDGDLSWLAENVDLGVPYPALRFLDQLASQLRMDGRLDREGMKALLNAFLDETDAFDEFEEHLKRKGAQLPGARPAASDALDLIAEEPAELGASEDRLREGLERGVGEKADLLFSWLLETFPLRREGGRVLFASRLFHRWWRRQLAEAEVSR